MLGKIINCPFVNKGKNKVLRNIFSVSLGIGALAFVQAQEGPNTHLKPVVYEERLHTVEEVAAVLQGPGVTIINPRLTSGMNTTLRRITNKDNIYVACRNIYARTRLSTQMMPFTGGLDAGLEIEKGVAFGTGNVIGLLGWNKTIRDDDDTRLCIDITERQGTRNVNKIATKSETYEDPDLIKIEPEAIHNVLVYEFDATISEEGNGLSIEFQFGSEEYIDFIGSEYNDIFGFFVSGPGIDGTLDIARLNGLPITVNTVNDGIIYPSFVDEYEESTNNSRIGYRKVMNNLKKNKDYYINNGHGTASYIGSISIYDWFKDENSDTEYRYENEEVIEGVELYDIKYEHNAPEGNRRKISDIEESDVKAYTTVNGLTKLITSNIVGLVPGEIYTFKIALADTFDNLKDSVVFIRQVSGVKILESCFKPGVKDGVGLPSQVGVSTIGMPYENWPNVVPNAHLVMESNEKGFAINQVNSVADIAEPVEGMLVYDNTDQCVKLYNGESWNCLQKACFND